MRNFEKIFDFRLLSLSREELLACISELRRVRPEEIAAYSASKRKKSTNPRKPRDPNAPPKERKKKKIEDLLEHCKSLGVEVSAEILAKLQQVGRPPKQKKEKTS